MRFMAPRHDELNGYERFLQNTSILRARLRRWKPEHFGVLIQIAALVVTTVYVVLTFGLLRRATDAAEVANRQLALTDRPWLKESLAFSIPTHVDRDGTRFFPQWTLENVGRSVATGVSNHWSWYIEPPLIGVAYQSVNKQREVCAQGDVFTGGEDVVFPNETKSRTRSFVVYPYALSEAVVQSREEMPHRIVLVGCIAYNYSTSPRIHHPGFIYMLRRRSPPGQVMPLTADWLFSAPLRPDDFIVERFLFGSAPVD
jgi:hypothetical protein